MVDVLVFGSLSMDFVSYVRQLPKPGEIIHGHRFESGFGGKAGCQCVQAARLGSRTALIAKLGDDDYGDKYMRHLLAEKVNVEFVNQVPRTKTGINMITISDKNQKYAITIPAANNLLSPLEVSKAKKLFNTSKVLVCQNDVSLNANLTAMKRFKGTILLKYSPAPENPSRELLRAASIVCVSRHEAARMINSKDKIKTLDQAKYALDRLIGLGAKAVIITMRALGAVYYDEDDPDEYYHVPAPKIKKVVDPSGSGNSFVGALAFFLANNPDEDLHQQIGAACYVASVVVQKRGSLGGAKAAELDLDLSETTYEYKNI